MALSVRAVRKIVTLRSRWCEIPGIGEASSDAQRNCAMQSLQRLTHYLLVLGIPGVFAISLLDAAAIPLVGGPDGIVALLAWQKPAQLPWIVLAAALGSTIGCAILYRIGRAGGDLALSRLAQRKQ